MATTDRTTKLGDDLTVSAIGFGAGALTPIYGDVDDAESLATLNRCLDLGVTFIDTANVYGGGSSERLIEEQRATPAQVALAWLRYRAEALGAASVPIPGTRRASRVEENLGSLSVTLTPAQLTSLDAAGAAVAGNRTDDLSGVSAGRE